MKSMKSQAYELAPDAETDDQHADELSTTSRRRLTHGRTNLLCILIVALACTAIGYSFAGIIATLRRCPDPTTPISTAISSTRHHQCQTVSNRHEWRSLSRAEKQHYLSSVQCLKTIPSRLGLNQSLYDDFPMVHARIGVQSHGAAGFLSWHRYYVHVYEQALRDECGYTGNMT
jgi:hypothetical protein